MNSASTKSLCIGLTPEEWHEVTEKLLKLKNKKKRIPLSAYIQTEVIKLKAKHCKKQYIKSDVELDFKRPKVSLRVYSSIEQIGIALKIPTNEVVFQLIIKPLLTNL